MKSTELLDLLSAFYADKLAMRQRHDAAARDVADYDFNNTYQYVIAREDLQLNWLRDAITDLGGTLTDAPQPDLRASGKGLELQHSLITADRDAAQAFVDRWRPKLTSMSHARHRNMLNVILGETLEHKRFFEQALAGRTDLLGRRADGAGTGGGVLRTRWVE